jgi:1-acyl-sn-glycerol-3-phosphate acyltransferase
MSARRVGESRADDRPWRKGALVTAVKDRAATLKPQIVPRSMRAFPFTAPTTPTSVEPLEPEDELGINFDTEWAREPGARVARAAIQDTLLIPGLRALTKPTVHGLDRFEHLNGPIIFTANHHSHLDTGLVLASLPRKFRSKTIIAAGADYFFDKRPKAFFSALTINAVPIERKKVSRRSTDQVRALIAEGWNLVIFPEGGRSPDGLGQEFKAGATYLALKQGCPLVPVHIDGTNKVLPKGKSFPKRHECIVTFGNPVIGQPDEDARELSVRLELAVDALAEESRSDWWTARRNAAAGLSPSLRGIEDAASWRRQWARTARDKPKDAPKRKWP